jgi:hypothetical protein
MDGFYTDPKAARGHTQKQVVTAMTPAKNAAGRIGKHVSQC